MFDRLGVCPAAGQVSFSPYRVSEKPMWKVSHWFKFNTGVIATGRYIYKDLVLGQDMT